MARFDIISKDGSIVRYSGKPRYIGTYLKPSHLEFNEIASPVPIAWEVGDYVDYPRTGMRYYLYSIPQPTKKARKDTYGGAFVYSGVQFHAATKELEIAPFRDLVSNDNNIHFSTAPDVATFENVEGIARRIQACMDDLYPERWEIRIAEFDAVLDAEIVEKISEAKDFALSGGTCLDALSRIYELWQDIGWIHSYENGKEVITIGYANKRIDANTTDSYLYGKGNGLTAIKRNQTNKDEFATRLYVYGSERNLPARYYNGLDILNAESVDIRNLMLPLDSWGVTDELPDARKAYLENAEAVAKYGVIPKTHYFDSDDAGADIYPSIAGMTIANLRKALDDLGQTEYYPSEADYPDASQRVDEVRFCDNPEDDGVLTPGALNSVSTTYPGFSANATVQSGYASQYLLDNFLISSHTFTIEDAKSCEVVFSPQISGTVADMGFSSVKITLTFRDRTSSGPYNPWKVVYAKKNGSTWEFDLPELKYDYAQSPKTVFDAYIYLSIEVIDYSGTESKVAEYAINEGTIKYSLKTIQDKTFVIRLNEIGFNIDEMAARGEGKKIALNSGACAGREFEIVNSRHKNGYWDITCKRQQDDTLGMMFPNSSYQIESGDRFVLLDIAMPELYVHVAMNRLLAEGQKLLARASKIQRNYEPSIDAKVMLESGRTLREGMFMEITDEDVVDNGTDYILIDALNIYEDESAIPTYKVTLRERRKVSYKGTPSATSTTSTKSVEDDSDTAATAVVNSLWQIDSDGNLVTDKQVIIKNNLIVEGDSASGGEGEDNNASSGLDIEQLQNYLDANEYVTASDLPKSLSDFENDLTIPASTTAATLMMTDGTLEGATQFTGTIGAPARPVYINAGVPTVCTYPLSYVGSTLVTAGTTKNYILGTTVLTTNSVTATQKHSGLYFTNTGILFAPQLRVASPADIYFTGTSQTLSALLADIASGGSIDLTGYATEQWVLSLGYLTSSALSGYATQSWVESKGYALTSALNSYLPKSGGTLNGALTVASTIMSSSVICGTGRLRVNAADSAINFGYMKAETYSTNRGVLRIGTNYGGSETITNAGVDVDAINIYRGVVGIGKTYTGDELYSNQSSGIALSVTGNSHITGQLAVSSAFSADGTAGVAGVFIRNEGGIEICHASTPYIDFHYANSTADYTNRLMLDSSGRIKTQGGFLVVGASQVQGNHTPMTDNSFTLGTDGYRWSTVYAVNGNYSGALTVGGTSTLNGALTVNAGTTINGNLVVMGDVASVAS